MKYKVLTLLLVCIVCITVVVISGCTSLPAGLSKSTAPQEIVSGGGGGGGGSPYASDTNLAYSGVVPTAVPTIATPSGGLPGQGVDTKIIKTAQVNLEVKNVTDAVEIIKEIGTGRGGYVSTTNIGKNYNGQATGTVVLRIPADQFDTALSGVKAVGTGTVHIHAGTGRDRRICRCPGPDLLL